MTVGVGSFVAMREVAGLRVRRRKAWSTIEDGVSGMAGGVIDCRRMY